MRDLDGKVVIVTGGTSGIGKAAALELASEGAKIVIAGRRADKGEEVVNLIKEDSGDAIYVQTDVSEKASVINLVNSTINHYGRLDCAFNNAGIGGDNLFTLNR